jgi:hypothetical protein
MLQVDKLMALPIFIVKRNKSERRVEHFVWDKLLLKQKYTFGIITVQSPIRMLVLFFSILIISCTFDFLTNQCRTTIRIWFFQIDFCFLTTFTFSNWSASVTAIFVFIYKLNLFNIFKTYPAPHIWKSLPHVCLSHLSITNIVSFGCMTFLVSEL